MMEELLPSNMTEAKMEIFKEDGCAKVMEKGGGCLSFMVFGVVR